MKTTHLEDKRAELLTRREKLIDRFGQSARSGKKVLGISAEIHKVNDFLESLERIASETAPKRDSSIRRYAVSSLFLHESFKKLTADQDEQFFFITGSEVEGVNVLDQWAEFAHQKRSLLGVTA